MDTEIFSNSSSLPGHPYDLKWVFGHLATVPPVNLSSPTIKKIFFAAGSIGVCYDWINNTQEMLYGHTGDIVCAAATVDKTHLVTADSGKENSVRVWNLKTRNCVYIISDYFSKEDVIWINFSSNGNVLMILSAGYPQNLSLWNWKLEETCPYFQYTYQNNEFQHYATLHPIDYDHFVSCGARNVYCFVKDEKDVRYSVFHLQVLYDEKMCKKAGKFTQTAYSTSSSLIYTATTTGMIVIWGLPLQKSCQENSDKQPLTICPKKRVCQRMLQLAPYKCSILTLDIVKDYLIIGTENSNVCCFDETFKLIWSIAVKEGPINSVSFNFKPRFTFKQAVMRALGKNLKEEFSCALKNDFIVCTNSGFAGYYDTSTSILLPVLYGTSHFVKALTIHPFQPYIYFGDSNGGLQKWNYETKKIMCKEKFVAPCVEIECLSIDDNGSYIACSLSNGNICFFNSILFPAKPCFVFEDIKYRPVMLKFSPDPQHLLVVDDGSYVSRFQLYLLIPSALDQIKHDDNVSLEEPLWQFNGKIRQHYGHILDSLFNVPEEKENIYFFTLGEDRIVIQYNISGSKAMEIEITKRICIEKSSTPICMCWYPIYDHRELFVVFSDDGKFRVYSLEKEKLMRVISMPSYGENLKRILLIASSSEQDKKYFIFNTDHLIGLAKFPLEGNPHTSLTLPTHIKGISAVISNFDQTYLFTCGIKDSWIYMYEIKFEELKKSEELGGEGIDAFKSVFPFWEDPEDMKQRLVNSIYSLELEMKMLNFAAEKESAIKGEIPINCLEYVMASLGCFLSVKDLEAMLNDIQFANNYEFGGTKSTLNSLDIMKLYANYAPKPLKKENIVKAFKDVLSLEDDPDKISRSHFVNILATRGDKLSPDELLNIVKCLKGIESNAFNYNETENKDSVEGKVQELQQKNKIELEDLIPEVITEEVFVRDILCLEETKEDLSRYILRKEDYNLIQDSPKVEDFVRVVEENFLWNEDKTQLIEKQ